MTNVIITLLFVVTIANDIKQTTGQIAFPDDSAPVNDFINYTNSGNVSTLSSEFKTFCPNVPLCTIPALPTDSRSCCGECKCSYDCFAEGSCCPDVLQYFDKSSLPIPEVCFRPQFLDYGVTNVSTGISILLTDSCPVGYQNTSVKDKCVTLPAEPKTLADLQSLIPVSSFQTRRTYRNKYCAFCNGENESNLTDWSVTVKCASKLEPKANSIADLIDMILTERKCNIVYTPGYALVFFLKICNWGKITKCNQTGTMEQYDHSLEKKCGEFTSIFALSYRNVFCYMCNTNSDPDLCIKMIDSGSFDIASFSALLDFNVMNRGTVAERPVRRNDSCIGNQIYDRYKNICRGITCPDGFQLINNKCHNIFNSQGMKGYEVFFVARSNNDTCVSIIGYQGHELLNSIILFLRNENLENRLCSITQSYRKGEHSCTNNQTAVDYVLIHIQFSFLNHKFHDVVDSLLKLTKRGLIFDGNVLHVTASRADFGVKYGTLDRRYFDPTSGELLTNLAVYDPTPGSWMMSCGTPVRLMRVSNFETCPRTQLVEEYRYKILGNDLCIPEISFCVKDGDYSSVENKMTICSVDYFSYVKNLKIRDDPIINNDCQNVIDKISHASSIVSLICTCVSMFFLLVTITTYSVFPILRTIPGMNNMCLAVTLCIAQALFQFGIGNKEMGVVCNILGGLVHYFWLSTICWMNICTFHMYRVFGKLRNRDDKSNASKFNTIIKYTIYCCTAPFIPILVNIAVSATSGHDYGYGGCLCYISTSLMVAYTFALPVGLVVLMNLCIFIFVSIAIARVLGARKTLKKKDRNVFGIYMKLSCLTGLTWVFGFLYTVIRVDALNYIFIVLNAGQGVFVFISFICNKRIFNLYKGMLYSKPLQSEDGSNRTKSTDTKTKSSENHSVPKNNESTKL